MHAVIFKNDAVGDLAHSLNAINNVISSKDVGKVTIFLSKLSQNYIFLVKRKNVKIKILNYNLTIIEKIKIIFFLLKNNINRVYILSPKNFYYFLPLIFRKTKFYAICVNNIKNYKRPGEFLRKFLYKYEINDRGKIFKRKSIKSIQSELTSENNKEHYYKLDLDLEKSEVLKKYLPNNYIFFHFKKKMFDKLDWEFKDLELLFKEFEKYSDNIILTKDIEFDNNNLLFKNNFNSYDFELGEFIDNKKNILFFDNIVGEDLFNVIKYSQKVVAFHGMMTSLATLLNRPILDLYHCKINSWEDYRQEFIL